MPETPAKNPERATVDTPFVRPINKEKLMELVQHFHRPGPNVRYSFRTMALFDDLENLVTDNEGLHSVLEKCQIMLHKEIPPCVGGGSQTFSDMDYLVQIPVYKAERITEKNWTRSIYPAFLLTLSAEQVRAEFLDPATSIRAFFGPRLETKPRIRQNAAQLLKLINEHAK